MCRNSFPDVKMKAATNQDFARSFLPKLCFGVKSNTPFDVLVVGGCSGVVVTVAFRKLADWFRTLLELFTPEHGKIIDRVIHNAFELILQSILVLKMG